MSYIKKKINRVLIIVSNPAYLAAGVEVDQEYADQIDPADLAPLINGSAPTVNAPASEGGEVAEDEEEAEDGEISALVTDHSSNEDEEMDDWLLRMSNYPGMVDRLQKEFGPRPQEDTNDPQSYLDPDVGVWDSGRMWEREYWLYPDTSREDLNTRLFYQVWNMLQIMQECI